MPASSLPPPASGISAEARALRWSERRPSTEVPRRPARTWRVCGWQRAYGNSSSELPFSPNSLLRPGSKARRRMQTTHLSRDTNDRQFARSHCPAIIRAHTLALADTSHAWRTPVALTSGTRLGPYEIVGQIGEGGMGQVYKAGDTRLDRSVAIKVLSDQISHDSQFKDRFQREARVISQLEHPNICSLYDVGDEGGAFYL